MSVSASPARRTVSAEGTVVLRPSWSSLGFSAVASLFPLMPLTTFSLKDGSEIFGWIWAGLATVSVVSLVVTSTRRRLVLGWEGRLTYRSLGRSRSIEAADIQAITVGEGSLTRPVQAWTAERKRVILPAVTGTDLNLVGDWWLAHRGGGWQPAWTSQTVAPSLVRWWA